MEMGWCPGTADRSAQEAVEGRAVSERRAVSGKAVGQMSQNTVFLIFLSTVSELQL